MKSTFDDVSRVVFDAVSDRLHSETAIFIYYNGTNLRGKLTIETKTSTQMEKALKIFLEEFSR